MQHTFVLRSLSILLAILLIVPPSFAANDDPALRKLIELLDDSPDLEAARQWFKRVPATGSSHTLGVYAMSLHLALAGECNEADELLATLGGSARSAVQVLRLRLWLGLELGDTASAKSSCSSLAKSLATASLPPTEAVLTSRLLGGLCGAGEEDADLLAVADWKAIEEALGARAGDDRCRDHYLAARKKSVQRRVELASQAKRWEALEPEKLQEQQAELAAACERLAQEIIAEDDRFKQANLRRRKEKERLAAAAGQHGKWVSESRKPTPGKPKEPTRPTPPKQPVGKPTEQEQRDWQVAQAKYQIDLRTYEGQMVDFRRVFDAWSAKDKARRDEIDGHLKTIEPELAAARTQEKAATDESSASRKQKADLQTELDASTMKLRLANMLLSINDAAPDQFLSRPSLYDLLSPSAEMQRLKQLTQR